MLFYYVYLRFRILIGVTIVSKAAEVKCIELNVAFIIRNGELYVILGETRDRNEEQVWDCLNSEIERKESKEKKEQRKEDMRYV